MTKARRLWLTYAWVDNEAADVDYIAQELDGGGVTTLIDRRQLVAGKRLWEQIGDSISSPTTCDAWGIYVTENSLASQACQEELEYAINRALNSRGGTFPIIGIFPAPLPTEILPPSIRSRLYVSLTDDDWLERVRSGVRGEAPQLSQRRIPPIHVSGGRNDKGLWIEAHPRAGRWAPIILAVLVEDEPLVEAVCHGPSGVIGGSGMAYISRGQTNDGRLSIWQLGHNASPIESVHFRCTEIPKTFVVGDLKTWHVVDMASEGEYRVTTVPVAQFRSEMMGGVPNP